MKPSHVLDFVEYTIIKKEKLYEDSWAKYNKLMAEYKAMPFYKRWLDTNPEYGYWPWHYRDYIIKQLNDIKLEALYKIKMEYPIMTIPENWHKAFYKWAQDNKIPY